MGYNAVREQGKPGAGHPPYPRKYGYIAKKRLYQSHAVIPLAPPSRLCRGVFLKWVEFLGGW